MQDYWAESEASMSDIQRWRSDHDGEMYMIPHDPPLDDSYVKTADHIADRAELVRLLRVERGEHKIEKGCIMRLPVFGPAIYEDRRCDWCKEVDARLEGL